LNSNSLPFAILSATCGSIFDPARLHRELKAAEEKLADPAMWSNPAASQPIMRDRKRLELLIADDEALVSRLGDIEAYFELAKEGAEEVLPDLEREMKSCASFARRWKRRPCSPARPIR
jgi:peptide chain release factor 2